MDKETRKRMLELIKKGELAECKESNMSEMPSTACEGCGFLKQGCTVPGGICGRRLIHGTRKTVWHVLQGLGLATFDEDTRQWFPTTPRSDVQLFSNSICPHCGGQIRVVLERREDE